ncbi:phosphomannomutase/phosphoglucomutase [Halopseudomonas sp. SMJS2]|uniref:phosphomannomutase/phosphoglucomutase n=1 Tax=Halopseudomonas sp. SMJS2 TaxID=3041098 RepID=UPI00245300A5|nr:phosphomannomutase/phosphoglucomutase [Halopseudomonas sp. SMJS2]WGK61554.1 phosphomannomutase/phosphoglucomutase [Halopseudomonas sp. SMJS2]
MKLTKPSMTRQPSTVPGTLAPLLVMLASLAAALTLLWLLLFAPAADSYRSDLSQAYAIQQQSALNRALAQLDTDVARAAANPQLQALLQQQGSLRPAGTLVHQLATYLHRPGAARHINDAQAPLSFAALDMIRRAERGLPVPAEAHKVGEHWRLYLVEPLRTAPTAPIAGTLLVVFELQRLTAALPQLPQDAGKVALIQQFPAGPAQPLYQAGSGHGDVLSLATDNPAWRLEFQAGSAMGAGAPNPLVLLAAVLLALAGALASLLLLQRSWNQALAADAQTLEQLTQGHKAAGLRLGPLEPLAQSIMQLVSRGRQAPVAPAASQPVRPTPPVADSAAAPLPPLEDVLDIDILDDLPDEPMAGAPSLPAEIFRAYDIRGVVGRTLSAEYVYWLGRAIGSESLDAGQPRVAVARDGRLSGPELLEQLIRGLTDCGCQVVDLGMVPTPVLYYATHTTEATSGVMLTGSHNPPDYNGLKIVIAGQTLSGERISALRQRLEQNLLHEGNGECQPLDILDSYTHRIVDDVLLARPLKVVVDCGNGVGGVIAQNLLEQLGCEVVALYCEVDGNFPNHHPDPGKPENLRDLQLIVKQHNADLGLAFDGDADRLGVVMANGEIICADRLLMLFAEDIVTRNPGADIVFDVKCTRQLPQLISRLGGRPVMWKSGHSLIKVKMQETQALLGGEMSGHVFFQERWYGFDDGLYSACRLLELVSMLTQDREQINAMFDRYPTGLSTPELHVEVGEKRKFALMNDLENTAEWGEQARVTTIDGLRVDYPDGWGLVRASNTTPVLVLRFEAEDAGGLERIRQRFREQLTRVAPDLTLNNL